MEIERIARKLEPLMPSQVKRWLRIRERADADFREQIDQQILAVARKKLGNFEGKILLSLPPSKRINGALNLGSVVYDGEKWKAGITKSELLQGLAIFGRSGAGKTNTAFHILKQLSDRKIPFLFLDWKRTGRHLIPLFSRKVNLYTPGRSISEFPFNPFITPPGLEAKSYVNHVVDLLADAYTLGDGARSVLQKALSACYAQGNESPSVSDVIYELQNIPDTERVRGWKISALRALESLSVADISSSEKQLNQEELVNTLLEQSTILELNGLSPSSKKFLIPTLCLWIYYVKLGSRDREKLKLAILVEEAHHVLHRSQRQGKESVMEMLLRQCREIGIGMIVIDQHPHLMSSAALGNTYASLCFNLKDPRDVNKAAALSLVGDREKQLFSVLAVGHAIAKLQDRWTRPFLIKVPEIAISKGVVTDQELRRYLSDSANMRDLKGNCVGIRQIRISDDVLNDEELKFVRDVVENEDDGVRERYKRLGLSGDRGNRVKKRLVEWGWLDTAIVPVGRSRKVILRLTTKAKNVFGLKESTSVRESLAHEYWKRKYADMFRNEGYDIRIEALRVGGYVDVLGSRKGERVGIEIETGNSDVVRNVKNCLLSGFRKVFVVATSEKAMTRIEKELARAELLIPGRVKILNVNNSSERF